MARHYIRSAALGLLFLAACSDGGGVPAPRPAGPVFEDTFETGAAWGMFEEIVGGSPCYGDGIGEVDVAADPGATSLAALRVHANQAGSTKSSHVIAQRRLSDRGVTGFRQMEFYAWIDPATTDQGETGPEFSLQNTLEVAPGIFRTMIAGIQYRASPYDSGPGSWAVWKETAPGQADWEVFLARTIQAGTWYYLSIEADFDALRYGRFILRGGGLDITIDLGGVPIAQEDKFTQEALWATVEAENLWNNCGAAGPFEYVLYYDDVTLWDTRDGGP